MCYEYELEYQLRRAEEARKELKKAEEQRGRGIPASPKPAAPAEAPEETPVPA